MTSRKRSPQQSLRIKEREEKRQLKVEKREERRLAKKLKKQNGEKEFPFTFGVVNIIISI